VSNGRSKDQLKFKRDLVESVAVAKEQSSKFHIGGKRPKGIRVKSKLKHENKEIIF
jgi:hypothetical protein